MNDEADKTARELMEYCSGAAWQDGVAAIANRLREKDAEIAKLREYISGRQNEIAKLKAEIEKLKSLRNWFVPDESPGDVIDATPDGQITLDDGITTWNARRACEFLMREKDAEVAKLKAELQAARLIFRIVL